MNTAKKYGAVAVFMIFLVVSMPVVFATELNLVYDANGNLLYGDGKYREYNSLNQLVRIRSSDNSTILEEYVHDPIAERILVKRIYNSSNQVGETVYYVDENFVRVVNTSGTYDFTYVKDESGNLVGQINPDGTKLFMHNDLEGSVGIVTNSSGGVVENTLYSPHGEILSGGTVSRFDSEGKEFDSLVGDYDFNFRKMNPSWGLFLQPDTLIKDIYNPQTLNRYMFELGNPYRYTDPTGHSEKGPFMADAADRAQKIGEYVTVFLLIPELNKEKEEDQRYEDLYEQYRLENPDLDLPASPYVNVMRAAGPGKAVIQQERRVNLDTLESWNSGKSNSGVQQPKTGNSGTMEAPTKPSSPLTPAGGTSGNPSSGGFLSKIWSWITGTKESTEKSGSSDKPSSPSNPPSSTPSSPSGGSPPKKSWWCIWCK